MLAVARATGAGVGASAGNGARLHSDDARTLARTTRLKTKVLVVSDGLCLKGMCATWFLCLAYYQGGEVSPSSSAVAPQPRARWKLPRFRRSRILVNAVIRAISSISAHRSYQSMLRFCQSFDLMASGSDMAVRIVAFECLVNPTRLLSCANGRPNS